MSKDDDNNEHDERGKAEKPDVWYKLRAVGGISTAIVAALIGVLGSMFLHSQQESSNRIHLYTQIMSEQEKAENAVRTDMFTTILASFLTKEEDKDECVIDNIDRQLLELDMIARNFHETMDFRPLFVHVLLKIVRDIPRNYSITDNELITVDKLDYCKKKTLNRLIREDKFRNADIKAKRSQIKEYINRLKRRRLKRINDIATRITTKQLESLNSVMQRMRYTIDLTKTCDDISPGQTITGEDKCDKKGEKEETKELVLNSRGDGDEKSERTFTISSTRSYEKWNQVLVKVTTNKSENEKKADPDGGKENTVEFWVGFFDFPLVDNTFLSSKERYAVILDSINENEARISLLYFPASYAGFKERSYYQHRIINTLLSKSL